jgi:hypothetical protein
MIRKPIYTPPRTPWMDHLATERRANVAWFCAKVAAGLVFVALVFGYL